MKRILVYWSTISGYMAACWRELASRPGVQLRVVAYRTGQDTSFSEELMRGIDWVPLDEHSRQSQPDIEKTFRDFDPDVVVIAGWINKLYVRLPAAFADKRRLWIMGMDRPWQGGLRQWIAPVALRSYLQRIDLAWVTGERCRQFAKHLGFTEKRIHSGVYGVDVAGLQAIAARRRIEQPARRFLFVGRYVEEKGIDLLVDGYRSYRESVATPWDLTCCGKGVMGHVLRDQPGVTDRGFVQPSGVHDELAQASALIMPSRFDPWPLTIVESCAAGVPVACSAACGSAVELVRDGYSGYVFPTGDSEAIAETMRLIHSGNAAELGRRAEPFAAAYSAQEWANRLLRMIS
jgi:glycosyltransferase involved in cell wall biosynthesis